MKYLIDLTPGRVVSVLPMCGWISSSYNRVIILYSFSMAFKDPHAVINYKPQIGRTFKRKFKFCVYFSIAFVSAVVKK